MISRLPKTFLLITALLGLAGTYCTSSTRPEIQPPEPIEPDPPGATSVLFIGNSLTGFNAMPRTFKKLAENAGKPMSVTDFSIGGSKLRFHATNEGTLSTIKSKKWDVVVLQGSEYKIAFPQFIDELLPPIETLVQCIRKNHSKTKILFFLDYALDKNISLNGSEYFTPAEFEQMLIEGTRTVADRFNMIIAPVGAAWNEILHGERRINLYADDNEHPSAKGSYLMACVYFCTVFQETLDGNSYYGTLLKSDALFIQQTATAVTLDPNAQWETGSSDGTEISD